MKGKSPNQDQRNMFLPNFNKVLVQKRFDKNKIYSLHEPEVACIAKGKAHKKFEFGSKVSFAVVPGVNIIVGVQNFTGNPNDLKTLEPTLNHVEKTPNNLTVNQLCEKSVGNGQLWNP